MKIEKMIDKEIRNLNLDISAYESMKRARILSDKGLEKLYELKEKKEVK